MVVYSMMRMYDDAGDDDYDYDCSDDDYIHCVMTNATNNKQ